MIKLKLIADIILKAELMMIRHNLHINDESELEKLRQRVEELENREKQLIKSLRLNESLHLKILDALPINIFLEDSEGRTIFVNEQVCKAHGVNGEDLVGKTVFDFFPKSIAERLREIDLEVWKKRTLQTNEVST